MKFVLYFSDTCNSFRVQQFYLLRVQNIHVNDTYERAIKKIPGLFNKKDELDKNNNHGTKM